MFSLGRGDHSALHLGNAPLGIEHEYIGALAPAKSLHRRAAGIAGGRNHDGRAFRPQCEQMVHQVAKELHCQILERKRRSMKQLEHEIIHSELDERSNRRMAKTAIGFARHAREIMLGDGFADKGANDLDREFGIGPSGKTGNPVGFEPRPGGGHVKAAIGSQPRQRSFGKVERGGLAPG